VCSQVFDHTSVIRFLEARFGVHEPNISAWRRAVCGDLTLAFDFATPDAQIPALPDARAFLASHAMQPGLPAPHPPQAQTLHRQEPVQRRTRALPYVLHTHAKIDTASQSVQLQFVNSGSVGAVFHVFDHASDAAPKRYTVDANTQLAGVWPLTTDGSYDLEILGPNGFLRRVSGRAHAAAPAGAVLEVRTNYVPAVGDLRLELSNHDTVARTLTVTDNAYGAQARRHHLPAGGRIEINWALSSSDAWYDLTVAADNPADFARRYAGHVETGKPGKTDPALSRDSSPPASPDRPRAP
jgi:phospholipase C